MSEVTELAAKLKSEGDKVFAFFAGIAEDQWKTEVYTEGSVWTVRNILAHYVTAERGLIKLFENIRQGGEGASEDFSIDRYNARQQEKTKDLPSAELLDQYRSTRADTVAWVNTLADSDLEKRGRHPFLGVTTLYEMIKMIYVHNQIHYRDMRRVLK